MRPDDQKQHDEIQGQVLPTSEEQFDFFTRIWEPEPEEEAEAATAEVAVPEAAPAEEEGAEPAERAEPAAEIQVPRPLLFRHSSLL